MKKRYFIAGSLAFFQFWTNAQNIKDSTIQKVDKTAIELVYKHYTQDGNNSAITGGIGTEKLRVEGPEIKFKWFRSKSAVTMNLGADVITSASTDEIDFIPSSSSIRDTRYYLNLNYERDFSESNTSLILGSGISHESDYTSVSAKLGFTLGGKRELNKFSALFQYFDDDLRWGLINSTARKPIGLIYPSELRHVVWHDEFKRYSYNLKLGYEQVLNKRNVLGVFPELAYQSGLLSTSYHRIYFSDDSVAVEDLPDERMKMALGLKLNTFLGGNVILKNSLSGYSDSFGINAISFENETIIKLTPVWSVMPGFRLYKQGDSRYFAPFEEHDVNDQYHSSDYDLSRFNSYTLGLGVKHSPGGRMGDYGIFNTLIFRYNYFHRSNNLSAHSLSLAFGVDFYRSTKQERTSRIKP